MKEFALTLTLSHCAGEGIVLRLGKLPQRFGSCVVVQNEECKRQIKPWFDNTKSLMSLDAGTFPLPRSGRGSG